ncbi:hypothetical protein [Nonomuraea diastatica]|uniref:Uncharacterized protein n=1 Tax=Nonomuraea diastatica TaxID=1848329 RepID=A0A4R4WPI3_9ACTN|nr:hypothetical protein [Nonomuraea diastatica]TDD19164.1 hypothetical protein E1294_21770 [Nonomuraea diastatica]
MRLGAGRLGLLDSGGLVLDGVTGGFFRDFLGLHCGAPGAGLHRQRDDDASDHDDGAAAQQRPKQEIRCDHGIPCPGAFSRVL